jgi:hypothetical protein
LAWALTWLWLLLLWLRLLWLWQLLLGILLLWLWGLHVLLLLWIERGLVCGLGWF